ncbi:hypothetical protein BDW42DRAFT_176224 [Aspergillus taichungensis]|uniref:Secreted protein n=1 Tax=Aspergillus taichungensis TaxID=482145 RepID=A0A2J5HL62_9EURO|nr:hypothetical protein BDW42DRAFT_176224 [Aspergillus taichungensis]
MFSDLWALSIVCLYGVIRRSEAKPVAIQTRGWYRCQSDVSFLEPNQVSPKGEPHTLYPKTSKSYPSFRPPTGCLRRQTECPNNLTAMHLTMWKVDPKRRPKEFKQAPKKVRPCPWLLSKGSDHEN